MTSKKPGKLSQAIAVKKDPEVQKGTGLKGALIRKDGTAPVDVPKTTNLSAIHKAVVSSTTTTDAITNDDMRDRQNLRGLCFVIDATKSREATWAAAQSIQAQMFDALKEAGEMLVGIICHLGEKVRSLGWFKKAADAKTAMAAVSCIGGRTQIVPALRAAMVGNAGYPPAAIIMVGDCFEEDMAELEIVCAQLKAKKIKIYAFLEGYDGNGYAAYSRAAELTDGIFKRFGEDLSIGDLFVAAAVHATGNKQAFDRLLESRHKGALALDSKTLLLPGKKNNEAMLKLFGPKKDKP